MTPIVLLQRLHQHRAWANQRLLAAAAQLSDSELRAPRPIGQGSIWKSLLHMYAAEYVWLEALEGNPDPLLPGDLPGRLPGNQLGEGGLESFADLAEKWSTLGERWTTYLAGLSDERLARLVYKRSTSSSAGQTIGVSCSDILLHVCTHAQYTTAQTVNMLRQAGAESLPDVMLISLARGEARFRDA